MPVFKPAFIGELETRQIGNTRKLECETLTGSHVHAWLTMPKNREDWEQLYRLCPWRFPTLSPSYYQLWIEHYGTQWNPVLIVVRDSEGHLVGLFPLGKRDDLITGAGAQQAEYHGWLSTSKHQFKTFSCAQQALTTAFPGSHLRFRYLPPGFPRDAVAPAEGPLSRIQLRLHHRPLLQLDPARLQKTLAKKGNRSKLNQLKRMGEVTVRRITDRDEIESCLDALAVWYDLRQGAVNDVCPFTDDPHKKAFTLAWLQEQAADGLHLSCLRVEDRFVAGHLGVMERGFCQLAILGQSAEYAGCSPGKLQIYLTAQLLAKEGLELFDLTPGGDPWKERFASHHDGVFSLELYPNRRKAMTARLLQSLGVVGRKFLRWAGLNPHAMKRWAARPAPDGPTTPPMQRYRLSVPAASTMLFAEATSVPNMVNCGHIGDLLQFRPLPGETTRQRFLQKAVENLESGRKLYTIMDDDMLMCCAWLHEEADDAGICGPVLTDVFATPDSASSLVNLFHQVFLCAHADIGARDIIVELSPELAHILGERHANALELAPLASGKTAT